MALLNPPWKHIILIWLIVLATAATWYACCQGGVMDDFQKLVAPHLVTTLQYVTVLAVIPFTAFLKWSTCREDSPFSQHLMDTVLEVISTLLHQQKYRKYAKL